MAFSGSSSIALALLQSGKRNRVNLWRSSSSNQLILNHFGMTILQFERTSRSAEQLLNRNFSEALSPAKRERLSRRNLGCYVKVSFSKRRRKFFLCPRSLEIVLPLLFAEFSHFSSHMRIVRSFSDHRRWRTARRRVRRTFLLEFGCLRFCQTSLQLKLSLG